MSEDKTCLLFKNDALYFPYNIFLLTIYHARNLKSKSTLPQRGVDLAMYNV